MVKKNNENSVKKILKKFLEKNIIKIMMKQGQK